MEVADALATNIRLHRIQDHTAVSSINSTSRTSAVPHGTHGRLGAHGAHPMGPIARTGSEPRSRQQHKFRFAHFRSAPWPTCNRVAVEDLVTSAPPAQNHGPDRSRGVPGLERPL